MRSTQTTAVSIYVYSGCDTCRKALKHLDSLGVPYKAIPIRDQPPSKQELKRMLKLQGGAIQKLFNTSGHDYKNLDLKNKLPLMDVNAALELLASNGNLVKRPFLLGSDFGLVGFKPDLWKSEERLQRSGLSRTGEGDETPIGSAQK